MNSRETIHIIGAGCSGLTAAYHLCKEKRKVKIFEKNQVVGGRAKLDTYNRFILDSSAQFIFSNFVNFFHYANELQIADKIVPLDMNNLLMYRNKRFHTMNLFGILKFCSMSERLKLLRLIRFLRRHDKKLTYHGQEMQSLEEVNFAQWFKENYGESLLEYFAQPIISSLCLCHPERICASYGLTLLNSAIRKKAYFIEGGIGTFANKMGEKIHGYGGAIHMGRAVEQIDIDGGVVIGLKLDKGKYVKTNNVLSSVQLPILLELAKLPSKTRDIIKRFEYVPCIHIWLGLSSKIKDKGFGILFPRVEWQDHLIILESGVKPNTHTPSNKSMIEMFVFEEHARKLMQKTDEYIKEKLVSDLEKIFPEVRKHVEWTRISKIDYAMPIYGPGHAKLLNELQKNMIEGLHLCGDYMAMPSMEAAVYSGKMAAQRLVES